MNATTQTRLVRPQNFQLNKWKQNIGIGIGIGIVVVVVVVKAQ